MGEAHAQSDPAVIQTKNPFKGDRLKQYFPKYPDDFAFIRFNPKYLELMTDELRSIREMWQPQGVKLQSEAAQT